MNELTTLNRRVFLEVLVGAALTAGCSGAAAPASFGDVPAGNVSDVPVGTLRVVGGEPVVLGRDAGGLYAVTTTCTHAGCEVETSGTGATATLECPCHGSRFDRNGAVLQGPAGSPLVHFAVTVDSAGNIAIHGGQRVSATTRVVVA